MPAWASDPTPRLWKGALWGAFCLWALPALADPDLSGVWQNIDREEPFCQDYTSGFEDRDGLLLLHVFPDLGLGWPVGRHHGWVNGRLDLDPAGEGMSPMWMREVEGGLDLCKIFEGKESCTRFRRCPLAPSS